MAKDAPPAPVWLKYELAVTGDAEDTVNKPLFAIKIPPLVALTAPPLKEMAAPFKLIDVALRVPLKVVFPIGVVIAPVVNGPEIETFALQSTVPAVGIVSDVNGVVWPTVPLNVTLPDPAVRANVVAPSIAPFKVILSSPDPAEVVRVTGAESVMGDAKVIASVKASVLVTVIESPSVTLPAPF